MQTHDHCKVEDQVKVKKISDKKNYPLNNGLQELHEKKYLYIYIGYIKLHMFALNKDIIIALSTHSTCTVIKIFKFAFLRQIRLRCVFIKHSK